jgi:hypothetical protein
VRACLSKVRGCVGDSSLCGQYGKGVDDVSLFPSIYLLYDMFVLPCELFSVVFLSHVSWYICVTNDHGYVPLVTNCFPIC